MKLNCLIIDDEPLARECIEGYAAKVEFLDVIGTGSNPMELTDIFERQKVDLLFLDIQMPMINGIDFLRSLNRPPMAIITTAYPDFAIEGFKLDVIDYVIKPITFDRFLKAVNKAWDYHRLQTQAPGFPNLISKSDDYFFVKCTNKFERIYFNDILYVQGLQNYVTIFTTKGKYVTHLTLKVVEENLNAKAFIRVHKSYIVAISRIDTIENDKLIIESNQIPISRTYRDHMMEVVVKKRIWEK
jgi:two-component system, LytTR family, response regulator